MEKFKIVFKPAVFNEIQAYISYYEEQTPGLGKKFYDCLSKNIERLQINPYYQVRYKNIRTLSLKRFPFVIHYQILETEKTVLILTVLHGHLNPEKWH
jgi:toxin ParE1/3/4